MKYFDLCLIGIDDSNSSVDSLNSQPKNRVFLAYGSKFAI